jgi:hypothetical protein
MKFLSTIVFLLFSSLVNAQTISGMLKTPNRFLLLVPAFL